MQDESKPLLQMGKQSNLDYKF
jgi:hypothetical protein